MTSLSEKRIFDCLTNRNSIKQKLKNNILYKIINSSIFKYSAKKDVFGRKKIELKDVIYFNDYDDYVKSDDSDDSNDSEESD